jgi:outer membrane protein OmpA-like peptidoglycan-associated protein
MIALELFTLNFLWEMAQARFYSSMKGLPYKRASDTKTYLAALGIDPQRMSTISYGKDKPFDPGHNETAWAENRRAHVVVTSASK